jgi:hypothetical protein
MLLPAFVPAGRAGLALVLAVLAVVPVAAEEDNRLAFRPMGDERFAFDTGTLQGTLKLDDRWQGISSMVHVPTGQEMTLSVGVFAYYRVFSAGERFGDGARGWPTEESLCPDGAVEVVWPPAAGHPVKIRAVYRFSAPDTLDLTTTVTPSRDMKDFELFLSNYFGKHFRARVYARPGDEPEAEPRFIAADRTPESRGGYVMYPRDDAAVAMIRDGRWKIPPSPVDWWIDDRLAAPLAMRRDTQQGITALLMCPPEDCFAVSAAFNPPTPEAGGYRSLYFSLFGEDLKAGQSATAHTRLVVEQNMSDARAVARYRAYLKDRKEKQ